jgi:PAS domain S-box-containing protein
MFHAVVDAAPDAILLVDHVGTIVYANTRTSQLFGYEAAELIGERVEMLVPERDREMHVMNREVYAEQPHSRGMGVGLHLTGRRRDGTPLPVEISLSPYHSGDDLYVVAIVRDVTELRRHEEVVRRSEARLRLLTENVADMIFRYRHLPAPAFEYVSAAATALTGYAPEEFYAHPELGAGIVFEDDRESLVEVLTQTGAATVAVRALRKDGALRWFEYSVRSSLDPQGHVVTEGVLRDVTDRRAVEEERQRLLAEIETQLERERIAGDLHDDVIQSVYSLGLALHGDRDDPNVTKGAALGRAIEGLTSVIADLRTYMRQLSGERGAASAREPFRPRIEALLGGGEALSWTVAIADDLELDEATERHVYLLVKELVSNVVRHAQAQHASIRLERVPDDGLEVEVRDDGVGYDPTNVPSTSYGLRSIDHRVAMLGAALEVDTAPGQGSRTLVRIPVDGAAGELPPAAGRLSSSAL